HPAARAARPRAARAGPDRQTAAPAQDADRRPRLRPRQVPPPCLDTRRQADHRPPPDRTRLRPRPPPLGRRAHLRLAAQPPPSPHPHRPPRRHPRSLPRPRLLPHLLAAARDLIELGPLTAAVPIGGLGTIVFGVWLAIVDDAYHVWDGWIVAAIVLWAAG